jgi:type 1 glutamine amidotransferase
MPLPARVNAYLVCGGRYHDMDYARVELLKLLGEHAQVRVRVGEDYSNTAAIEAADFLVTYTCDVIPPPEQQQALERFLGAGKRWLALHGTNSILKWSKPHKAWTAPRESPGFMQMLGSQFLAHPPIQPYRVEPTAPEHDLVRGIGAFDADDELYLCEWHGEHECLMHTHFRGDAPGFVDLHWDDDRRHPVLYLRRHGAGEILYCTLGHCRGQYDMQPMIAEYPDIERGSWKLPQFHEILRRGIRWGARIPS